MKLEVCNSVSEASLEIPNKIKAADKLKNKSLVNRTEYKNINYKFLELLMYNLIKTGEKYKLPCFLGYMQVVKYRTKSKKSIDRYQTQLVYGEYNKDKPYDQKRHVYHDKSITNGYNVKIHWYKDDIAIFKNSHYWSFQISRPWYRTTKNNKHVKPITLWEFFKNDGYRMYKTMGFKYELET